MKRKPILTLLLIFPLIASSQTPDSPIILDIDVTITQGLIKLCRIEGERQQDMCSAYIAGVVDTHQELERTGYLANELCLPFGFIERDLNEYFLLHNRKNPEELNSFASFNIFKSLFLKYPCDSSPKPVAEQFYTSSRLLEDCSSNSELSMGVCALYLLGALETYLLYMETPVFNKIYCIPDGTEIDEIIEVFIDFLNNDPEAMNEPAPFILNTSIAWSGSYKCS